MPWFADRPRSLRGRTLAQALALALLIGAGAAAEPQPDAAIVGKVPRLDEAQALRAGQAAIGRTVGDYTLLDRQGRAVRLSSLRGKTVVVNFWASWCSTCKIEAQVVSDVEKKWRDKGVVFLGVDSHDTNAGAATYQKQYGIEFDSVIDSDEAIGAQYNVTGLPETFFLDSKGTIVQKYVSAVDAATIDQLVGQAVAAG